MAAFCDTNVAEINIPNSVTHIGDYAFSHTYDRLRDRYDRPVNRYGSTQVITLNEGLESIGFRAFAGQVIRGITIPSTVKYLKNEAFYVCRYLRSVSFKTTVGLHIGSKVFNGCNNLSLLHFAGGNIAFGGGSLYIEKRKNCINVDLSNCNSLYILNKSNRVRVDVNKLESVDRFLISIFGPSAKQGDTVKFPGGTTWKHSGVKWVKAALCYYSPIRQPAKSLDIAS